MNLRLFTFLLLSFGAAWWLWPNEVLHSPGVLIPEAPHQSRVDEGLKAWNFEDKRVTPLAEFSLRARILGAERYRFDPGAELAPMDLALGWGRMSDTAVLEQLKISQRGRFYRYRWRGRPPIPAQEIVRSSANMHLIPATPKVRKKMLKARKGQIVALKGKLVQVDRDDGWRWRSSLTRNDTGGGACELVWVEEIDFADEPESLRSLVGDDFE